MNRDDQLSAILSEGRALIASCEGSPDGEVAACPGRTDGPAAAAFVGLPVTDEDVPRRAGRQQKQEW